MEDFTLMILGKFDETEITSIIDKYGNHWFTQDTISDALGVDRTTISRVRTNHPGEFTEGNDFMEMAYEGRRHVVYSEEGFMTICDMSTSETAYRLRRWMRQQFRVLHHKEGIVVQHRSLPREDLSDLGPDIVMLQTMLDAIAENRRKIIKLNHDQLEIKEEQRTLRERVEDHQQRIDAWNEAARVKPGEMTAIQVAEHCRWFSKGGGVHNPAVILAAVNHGYDANGLMTERREQGPQGMVVPVWVFSKEGFEKFVANIDSKYHSGQKFTLEPNEYAIQRGFKNKRHVLKG